MKGILLALGALLVSSASASRCAGPVEPFLTQVNNSTWIIGNDVWNLTQQRTYGVKLMYSKEPDLVGEAVGHYVSYNGAASNLNWTSAAIVDRGAVNGTSYINVRFTAREGDMHWIIFSGLAGAYQYFVNHDLPVLGEFRTLWRLDNRTFPYGKTDLRDELLPPLADYLPQNKVQDETWLRPDGKGYITKYDITSWIRKQTAYGVYGERVGSWYINAGKDYYNGNHLKQELMVHRESQTGDAVMLNMIHGTHFQASSNDSFPNGKMWGPWLWYLNNGSIPDAEARARAEFTAWPYPWFKDAAYHSRGAVKGKLTLSDGRPAADAAVFLGDSASSKSALDQGSNYYYTTYADAQGNFEFQNVRAAVYGVEAWSNGSALADVSTTFEKDGVVVGKGEIADLGDLRWGISPRTKLFQVGDFDRTAYGFRFGGAPYTHGLVSSCPADLVYEVGRSKTADWCFGQTHRGNWSIVFQVGEAALVGKKTATLIVSLAGYSSGASATVFANGEGVGNLTMGLGASDPSLYRSATAAGEWRYLEFEVAAGLLRGGRNEVRFELTKNTTWRGFMYDSVILEW